MSDTTHVIEKAIAPYIGQRVITKLRGYKLEDKRTSIFKEGRLMCIDLAMAMQKFGILLDEEPVKENLIQLEAGADFKLILTPLSEITEADLMECASIIYGDLNFESEEIKKRYTNEIRGDIRDDFGSVASKPIKPYFTMVLNVYQYLQHKGYDTTNHFLENKTLQRSHLAFYKNEIQNITKWK